MSGFSVSDKKLREALPEEQERLVAKLREGMRARPNGGVEATRQKLQILEARHGMSTQELRRRVYDGEQPETQEVGAWLMMANMLDRMLARCR